MGFANVWIYVDLLKSNYVIFSLLHITLVQHRGRPWAFRFILSVPRQRTKWSTVKIRRLSDHRDNPILPHWHSDPILCRQISVRSDSTALISPKFWKIQVLVTLLPQSIHFKFEFCSTFRCWIWNSDLNIWAIIVAKVN